MAAIVGRTGADLQHAIANWLLTSEIRIRSSRHPGAIAGWLNADGEPVFAYPEIAGYYLTWLAFLAGVQPGCGARQPAVEVVQWLDSVTTPTQPPATRYYCDGRPDWRNDATFTFDLAMVCRGLHAVRNLVPGELRSHLLDTLLRQALPVFPLLPEGEALPVYLNESCRLPQRWSTSPGPFQLKTASALLAVMDHPACWRLYSYWSGRVAGTIQPGELHAALYAIEGLMQFGWLGRSEAFPEAAACFETILRRDESLAADPRSDVIAQALRAGCVLKSLGFLGGRLWDDRLQSLRVQLEDHIDSCGRVRFGPLDREPLCYNAWAAMFAHQAIWFHEAVMCCPSQALPLDRLRSLYV